MWRLEGEVDCGCCGLELFPDGSRVRFCVDLVWSSFDDGEHAGFGLDTDLRRAGRALAWRIDASVSESACLELNGMLAWTASDSMVISPRLLAGKQVHDRLVRPHISWTIDFGDIKYPALHRLSSIPFTSQVPQGSSLIASDPIILPRWIRISHTQHRTENLSSSNIHPPCQNHMIPYHNPIPSAPPELASSC